MSDHFPTHVQLRPDAGDPVLEPLAGETAAGKYQLQGEIARGGVGTVLKGVDTQLGRDVAIKLLRAEYLGNPELLQRFVEEAQIGGQLQHPGIVPVYDLGMQGDQPFFSMKLVKGRTLTAMLEERESPAVELRRYLAIFEQVCHTMAYAHARSVIHRDLKPSNIMVGAFGEVQVVDWGMGKVLGRGGIADETRAQLSVIETVRSEKVGSHSVVGSVMGTPAYMPPEQARGEVEQMDERSDVFALGAVLCEILTGAPPYVGEQRLEMAARADLDACFERLEDCTADDELKRLAYACLAPARAARPRNASEIAERVGAYLTSVDERVENARVEAAAERVKLRAAKRAQKLTLGIAASVLLTLVVGGGGWWWWSSQRAQRQADAGRVVQTALDEARVAFGQEEWSSALSSTERADALAQSGDVASELKQRVADHLVVVRRKRADAVERDARLEREREMLAVLEGIPIPPDDAAGQAVDPRGAPDARRRDQEYREAFRSFGLAIEESKVADVAARIAAMSQPELWAAALDDWAWAAHVLHGHGGLRERLLDVGIQADPDAQRVALRELRKRGHVKIDELRKLDASTFPPMTASLLALMVSLEEPERAFAILHAAFRRHPDSVALALQLARSHFSQEQYDEALRFASVAAALRPRSTSASYLQGTILRWMERYEEAETALRRAIRNGPTNAGARHVLGHALDGQKRWDDALAAYRNAVEVDPDDSGAHSCLGRALYDRGQLEESERHHRRAVELAPREAMAFNNLGSTLHAQSRFDEAEEAFRKAIELDPRLAMAHANLGNTLVRNGEPEEALKECDEAEAIDPNYAELFMTRAGALIDLARLEDAERAARRGMKLAPHHGRARAVYAQVLSARGEYEAAVVAFREAIALDPRRAAFHLGLGFALHALDRSKDALVAYQTASDLDPKDANAVGSLGFTLWRTGEFAEAIRVSKQALAIDSGNARALKTMVASLYALQQYDEALPFAQQFTEVLSSDIEGWLNLGMIRFRRSELSEAESAFAEAIERAPGDPRGYATMGDVYETQGKPDDAIDAYREAYRLDPEFDGLRMGLANRLFHRGRARKRKADFDRAAEDYREAVKVKPDFAEAWCNLGGVLRAQGRYVDSLRHYEEGHALGSKQADWKYDSAKWVENAKKRAAAEPRLESILALTTEPRDGDEADDAAWMGLARREYALVVSLVRAAGRRFPELRYSGACAAALAAAGDVSDEQRRDLRAEALAWLRADLADGPTAKTLKWWLDDADLASIRDGEIPAEFESFWRDVRAAIAK